jgi:cholesterol transport system auxiliary component
LFLKLRNGRPFKALPILAVAFVLAGCSLFRGPTPETYDLTGPQTIPRLANGTAAQILIPEPSALKILDSDKIVVASGSRLYYYPEAQWPDRMPRVFQARAIEAFENSRKAKAVGRPGEGLSIDYQIIANIRSFEYRVTSDTGGYAHVEVYVKIMDDRNGRIVATRTLTGDAPVVRGTATEVAAGLDAAMSVVLIELVRWTLGVV